MRIIFKLLLHPPADTSSIPGALYQLSAPLTDVLSSQLGVVRVPLREGLRESWLISTIFKKRRGREQKAFRPSFTEIAFPVI